jgi:hypothetical protein
VGLQIQLILKWYNSKYIFLVICILDGWCKLVLEMREREREREREKKKKKNKKSTRTGEDIRKVVMDKF